MWAVCDYVPETKSLKIGEAAGRRVGRESGGQAEDEVQIGGGVRGTPEIWHGS